MLNKDNNPWLGLASYQYEDAYRFFGREKELEKLKECVSSNLITTIYGISGSGKTSLINAGMCPLIEKENFLPVRIRLKHDSTTTYSQQIIKAVSKAMAEVNGEIEVIDQLDNPELVPEKEKLWLFFYASTFWSATNHHIYPVIFIDQFEEIFTKNDNDEVIRDFFESISALQYDNPPAAITRILENGDRHTSLNITQDFRVVLIMREDFLARLEDYAYDSPALRKNRVGIKRMNGNQALEVITRPIPGLVSRDVALRIIAKVAGREIKDNPSFLEQLSVDTSLLSLFCSEVYLKAVEQKHEIITRELIDQLGENILASFYSNTMKLVPQPTAEYLETHLLTRSGFRNSVAMEDIVADGIRMEDLGKLCAKRLIRIETSEGTERVEFTHDVLCAIAKEHRDKVIEKTSRKQSNSRTINFLIELAAPLCIFLPLVFYLYINNSETNFLGAKSEGDFFIVLVCSIVLFFNILITCPYRHTKDRNAIYTSLIAWLVNNFCIGLLIVSTDFDSTFYLIAVISNMLFYLIQFIGSFRFNRKRSFKQAVKYIFHRQVYKDYPEMKTVLRLALLVVVWFISFMVGLSMDTRVAYVTAPLCALATFWLLCDLTGHTRMFDKKAIFNYLAQAALVILILASQFYQYHLPISLLCLAALLTLTIFYILKDDVPFTLGKKIRHMALIWGLAFAIVPTVNAGYNIYNCSQYHRVSKGVIDKHKILRFLIVEDAQQKLGVRDRWHLMVPVENDSIMKYVWIDFTEKNLTGLLSFERSYSSTLLNNDIEFVVFNDDVKEDWACSNHLDMDNIGTTLIMNYPSFDHMRAYLTINKEKIKKIPFFSETEIERFNKSHDFSVKDQPWKYYNSFAHFTLFTGDFEQAEEYARKTLEADSTYIYGHSNLFSALYLQGKYNEARVVYKANEHDKHQYENGDQVSFKEGILRDFDKLVEYDVIDKSIKKNLKSFLN